MKSTMILRRALFLSPLSALLVASGIAACGGSNGNRASSTTGSGGMSSSSSSASTTSTTSAGGAGGAEQDAGTGGTGGAGQDAGADGAAPPGILTRQGTQLFLNGAPYKYVGFNFYGLGGCEGITYTDAEMDAYFASLRPNSITRTWAFEAQGLTNLTRAIKSAEAHGQMLILSLADADGYCGETDGLIGSQGSGKTAAWYASGYKVKYIPWVQKVVGMFKDSPAIGMWELMNEPGTGNTDAMTLRALLDDAAQTIKQIDDKHLVESGTLAEYIKATNNYAYIHAGPNIDVGSLHEYDYDYMNSHTIISPHLNPTLLPPNGMEAVDKPLIVGESGIKGGTASGCTTPSVRAQAFKQKFDGYLAKGVVGITVWNYTQAKGACTDSVNPGDPLVALMHDYVIQ